MSVVAGPEVRAIHVRDVDAAALVAAKHAQAQTVSVCLPARDEAATVGPIVAAVREGLVDRLGLVDEVLVVDDHSSDGTAEAAAAAGARVVDASTVLAEFGSGHGKGEALWKSLYASTGDLVVWCDADIRDFDVRFVIGLLAPLLHDPDVGFVKGFYERPTDGEVGGGRVTELAARPALSLLFPALASVVQPLAGEYAGRRTVLEQLPFVTGYGVDLGLLIDVADRFGADAIAQVDLGVRHHRNRTLDELGPQALVVLQAALARAGVPIPPEVTLVRPGHDPVTVRNDERPPLATLASYGARVAPRAG